MPVTDEFLIYLKDQLADMGPVTSRRMFGGAGLYCDGLIFAIVVDDVLYFKVDDSNRTDYETAGMGPFIFVSDRGQSTLSYYEVPADVLENKEKTSQWALKALVVAQAAKKTKTKPAKKPKKKLKKK
jgi:DNA transformation protein